MIVVGGARQFVAGAWGDVTLDSPERNDIAHIMVSDSTSYQDGPIVSTVVRSLAEAEAVIRRIVEQWKRPQKKLPSPLILLLLLFAHPAPTQQDQDQDQD